MIKDLIKCSSNYGTKCTENKKAKNYNLPVDKKLLEVIPDNGSCADFENTASIDDMIDIQRLCKKSLKGIITKDSIIKMYECKYKKEKLIKYIERCMR